MYHNNISTAEWNKMLSRLRLTEDAISAEAHRTCYHGRGSQNMLSRPRLTERAITAQAHRICYLGRGSENVLSSPSNSIFQLVLAEIAYSVNLSRDR